MARGKEFAVEDDRPETNLLNFIVFTKDQHQFTFINSNSPLRQ